MTDFEHEIELDEAARLRWMQRNRQSSHIVRKFLEFDKDGK
jgi:hypothetical protein